MSEMDKYIFGIFGIFTAFYGWLLRHLFVKCQFKDVCEAERRRLDDCIEAEMRRNTERYEAVEKSLDELKQMIRDDRRGT